MMESILGAFPSDLLSSQCDSSTGDLQTNATPIASYFKTKQMNDKTDRMSEVNERSTEISNKDKSVDRAQSNEPVKIKFYLDWPRPDTTSSSERYVTNIKPLKEIIPPEEKQFFDLICGALAYDPSKRITAEQALDSPFFDPLREKYQGQK